MTKKEKIITLYTDKKNYYTKYIKQDQKLINYLNKYFYWTSDIKEQVYCLRNNIRTQPKCGYKPCNNFANFKGQSEGYAQGGCCRQHGQYISNLVKYGVNMPLQLQDIQDKCKKTLMCNHGVDNPMKSKQIAKKTSNTRLNYTDKQKEQYLTKRTKTNLERYGYKNTFEDTAKIKQKMIDKYGVENIAQVADFQDKRDATVKSTMKKYIWNTGEETHLQGYEPIVLRELEEEGYNYSDILTRKSDMPEIWYIDEKNIRHRYYADFYIPSKNLVIEVKSEYTMLSNFYINQLKAQATKKSGYNYKLEVR